MFGLENANSEQYSTELEQQITVLVVVPARDMHFLICQFHTELPLQGFTLHPLERDFLF